MQAFNLFRIQYLRILQEINQFKEFQSSIKNKLLKMEKAIISNLIQQGKPWRLVMKCLSQSWHKFWFAQSHRTHIDQESMTYNNRNTESKNSNLHTVNERKNTEITIEPENQTYKNNVGTDNSLLNCIPEKNLWKIHQLKV